MKLTKFELLKEENMLLNKQLNKLFRFPNVVYERKDFLVWAIHKYKPGRIVVSTDSYNAN